MSPKNLRSFLRSVEAEQPEGMFRVRNTPVEPEFEIPAIVRRFQEDDEYPLVRCDQIAGHPDFSVVTNVCASRDRIALSLDTSVSDYLEQYTDRLEEPLQPQSVDDGPVREVVKTGEDATLDDLPIITHGAREPGPYIDAGVVVLRDTVEERYNTGIYRIMQLGPQRGAMNIGSGQHGHSILSRAEQRGEPLEFALYVGHHPAAVFGSQVRTNRDEYEAIGGILGQPLELVSCETVDLEVPAHAEIAIEGRLLPGEREREGPFGEFHFLYGDEKESPAFEVTAITHRSDPIYYDIYNHYIDHVHHALVPLEAEVYQNCRQAVPETLDVHCPSTASFFTAIVQIEKERPGMGKQVGLAALSSMYYLKQVIVVDEEQDPHDLGDVLWAMNMKTRPERDIDMIENCYTLGGNPIGVSEKGWPDPGPLDTKVIIDASKPLEIEYTERAGPPEDMWRGLDLDDYE
jgi:2,5-furandicarboxylate decarboxylase 1